MYINDGTFSQLPISDIASVWLTSPDIGLSVETGLTPTLVQLVLHSNFVSTAFSVFHILSLSISLYLDRSIQRLILGGNVFPLNNFETPLVSYAK